MTPSEFNPMAKIFEDPKNLGMNSDDHEEMKNGDLHTSTLYDEEGDAHGGEAINPATGKPNTNVDSEPEMSLSGLKEIKVHRSADTTDVMGDIKDPSKMSLDELMKSQGEDN